MTAAQIFAMTSLVMAAIASWACLSSSPDSSPSVTRAVAPTFPAVAQAARAEGAVTIEAVIDSSGEVVRAKLAEVTGPDLYRHESYEQVTRQWRFARGEQTRTVKIKFVFRLMPPGTPSEELATVFVLPYEVEVRAERPEDVDLSEGGSK